MAIRLLTETPAGTKHFSCLSSDIPLLSIDVLPLSSALVTDSPGLIMIWDGDGWMQYPVADGTAATMPERTAALLAHEAFAAQDIIGAALSGDMILRVTPATTASSAAAVTAAIASTAGKFTRNVLVELVDSAGNVHTWSSNSFAVAGSEVTAGDGTAATSAETVTLDRGVGTCTLEYIGAWSGGVKQKETATAVATITTAGNATVVVTAAGMTGSPKTISVPVALNDGAAEVGAKIRAALAADTDVSAMFTVSGADGAIVLERKLAVANDGTLNIALADGDCVGLTTAASSDNTTAGVAADSATVTVTGGTVLGHAVANATSVDTLVQ